MLKIEQELEDMVNVTLALRMTQEEIEDLQDYMAEKEITDITELIKSLIKEELYR